MALEDDFATRMVADTALMAILTGGVWKSGAVGRLGITREVAASAFDATGYLKPCALVRQRAMAPTGDVDDTGAGMASAAQTVEVWLYEDTGYTAIDGAMARLFALLHGHVFAGGWFEARWSNTIDRQRDAGALAGASLARMDFLVHGIRGA